MAFRSAERRVGEEWRIPWAPDDYEKKHGWGHSCYVDSIDTAIDANVKERYLFHHDPNYDDAAMEVIQKHSNEIIKEKVHCLSVTSLKKA